MSDTPCNWKPSWSAQRVCACYHHTANHSVVDGVTVCSECAAISAGESKPGGTT